MSQILTFLGKGGVGKTTAAIADGDIKVDGQIELRKTCKIRAGQQVTGNGFTINVIAPLNL